MPIVETSGAKFIRAYVPGPYALRQSPRRLIGRPRPCSHFYAYWRDPPEKGAVIQMDPTWIPYPDFINPGDNAWQMTAATLVGLMSVPGLVVLYGGVMQKRWSVNSMMMTFVAFALVLISWSLVGFKFAFGDPMHILGHDSGILGNMWGIPSSILGTGAEQKQALIPLITTGPAFNFSQSDAGLFPVRVRGDHADPDAGLGAGPDQLQGVDPVRPALVDPDLHRQRLHDLGRRLVGPAGRARLLGWLRDPPRRRRLGIRRGGGDRATAAARPRGRRTEQPVDGRRRRRPALAGLERLQRRRPVLRGRRRALAVLNTNLACAIAFLAWIAWTT